MRQPRPGLGQPGLEWKHNDTATQASAQKTYGNIWGARIASSHRWGGADDSLAEAAARVLRLTFSRRASTALDARGQARVRSISAYGDDELAHRASAARANLDRTVGLPPAPIRNDHYGDFRLAGLRNSAANSRHGVADRSRASPVDDDGVDRADAPRPPGRCRRGEVDDPSRTDGDAETVESRRTSLSSSSSCLGHRGSARCRWRGDRGDGMGQVLDFASISRGAEAEMLPPMSPRRGMRSLVFAGRSMRTSSRGRSRSRAGLAMTAAATGGNGGFTASSACGLLHSNDDRMITGPHRTREGQDARIVGIDDRLIAAFCSQHGIDEPASAWLPRPAGGRGPASWHVGATMTDAPQRPQISAHAEAEARPPRTRIRRHYRLECAAMAAVASAVSTSATLPVEAPEDGRSSEAPRRQGQPAGSRSKTAIGQGISILPIVALRITCLLIHGTVLSRSRIHGIGDLLVTLSLRDRGEMIAASAFRDWRAGACLKGQAQWDLAPRAGRRPKSGITTASYRRGVSCSTRRDARFSRGEPPEQAPSPRRDRDDGRP